MPRLGWSIALAHQHRFRNKFFASAAGEVRRNAPSPTHHPSGGQRDFTSEFSGYGCSGYVWEQDLQSSWMCFWSGNSNDGIKMSNMSMKELKKRTYLLTPIHWPPFIHLLVNELDTKMRSNLSMKEHKRKHIHTIINKLDTEMKSDLNLLMT